MDWLRAAQELAAAGEPFALATVVRRVPPASAQPGAKALIRRDGTMLGWVGGSCAQPVVTSEARRALREGAPRLLRLGHMPGSGEMAEDLVEYPMTCHSGGALEILIEPVLPRPRLAIVGETPIAETLTRLADIVGYDVTRVAEAAGLPMALATGSPRPFVVVASMGVDDENAIAAALRAGAPYVALVASPKRAATVRALLLDGGVAEEQLVALKAPAGLDIGARTQEEIALSIMAEIAQVHGASAPGIPSSDLDDGGEPRDEPAEAVDPICGMTVQIAGARHVSEYDGKTWYFCCAGCKAQFDADPPRFAAA